MDSMEGSAMSDLESQFLKSANRRTVPRRLRAEPMPRTVAYPFISVDDHLVEPPDTFEGRLPKAMQSRAPRVVRDDDGNDIWQFGDERIPFLGGNVSAGWITDDWTTGSAKLEEARRGTWDIDFRVRDMDVNGVVASLNFPSITVGFAGQRFMRMKDEQLGLATMRAYNEWIRDAWTAPYPDRIIPCQVTWLCDAEVAAAEVRENAKRGFKAVAFTENPEKLGLPSIYSGYWDPFLLACQDTGTVINLHVGSSSETPIPSRESPPPVLGALFSVNGLVTAVDWLFARIPLRFPEIKIAISEGGIGWVPPLLDRLRYMDSHFTESGFGDFWKDNTIRPVDALRRNFWFTTFSDPSAFTLIAEIGVENVMFEADYPHADSSWPDSQEVIREQIGWMTPEDIARVTWQNAAAVYGHEVDYDKVTANMVLGDSAAPIDLHGLAEHVSRS
jgi:predicted TIM-barrel fold metal-dependent hydrolase